MSGLLRMLACSFVLFAATAAAQDVPADKVVIKGKRMTPEELERSDPVASLTREELMAAVTKRKRCANGTQEVGFSAGSFQLGDTALDASALVEAITPRARKKKLSCLRVVSAEYDRASFKQLGDALVEPLGVSLMWDKPGK
jgi:hypothetical protein